MKIFKVFVLCVLVFSGCSNSKEDLGKADLSCELVNIHDEKKEFKNVSYYEVFFDNKKVSKIKFSVEVFQKNTEKKELEKVFDAIESLYTNQKAYDGVKYFSNREDNTLNIDILFDINSLKKEENFVNVMGYYMDLNNSIEDYKTIFEADNFICK